MRVLFAPAGWRAEQTEGPLRAAGVEVNTVHFRPPAKLARLSLAGRTLATTLFARADILLCDMCSSLAMLPLAPALLRRWPLVLRPHSDLWREAQDMRMQGRGGLVRSFFDPGLQNWFYRRAAAILPVSEALREPIARNAGVDPDLITPIRLAVDAERFAPAPDPEAIKRELGFEHEHIVSLVMPFQFLQKVSGLERFLPVLRELVERHPDVAVIIAGDGILRRDFEQRNRELLDHPRLILPGHLDTIERLYQCSDVLAHFSLFDSWARVLYEAWACAKPVVVNDYAPLLQSLRPGENGYVLGNDAHVEEALPIFERLIYDADHRRELGEAGQEMVVRELSEQTLGRLLRAELEKLL